MAVRYNAPYRDGRVPSRPRKSVPGRWKSTKTGDMYGARGFVSVTEIIMGLGTRRVINTVLLLPAHHLNMVLHHFVLLEVRLVLKGCVIVARVGGIVLDGWLKVDRKTYIRSKLCFALIARCSRALSKASMQIHAKRR